ncbi:MAG: hypothetical protein ACI9W2_004936, partial [Gammaproteobacteria bacterium]
RGAVERALDAELVAPGQAHEKQVDAGG